MRIGVDASCWVNSRGYGRFTREIMTRLVAEDRINEYVFFIDSHSAERCKLPKRVVVVSVKTTQAVTEAAAASGRRSVHDMWRMARAVAREPLDLLFFPSVYTYFPVITKARKLVAIHDIIAERFPNLIFPDSRGRFFWRLKLWLALRQSDLVVTVSQHSKQGIVDFYNLDKDRVHVVLEAADASFRPWVKGNEHTGVLGKYKLTQEDRFFLYVGGFGPHKNIRTLINAFQLFSASGRNPKYKLLLAGDYSTDPFWTDSELIRDLRNHPDGEAVVILGFVPDEDLPHLYSAAEALIMPSFDEGFGLPALEAISCGTPVIGSETTSLPEIICDAGLFFDPNDVEALVQRMQEVAGSSEIRQHLKDRSLIVSKAYSWAESARSLRSIFEAAATLN